MSRGGGRFGGGKNILKGATWEQDPNFKPEARDIKPSDLFPVSRKPLLTLNKY